ncbi:hypothetical protein FRB91_002786 [Serendipita sp. 411]|nr:hypothetical protein FRC18_009123 [Serendipita sp. 400]KAG8854993.1 hypothetical protein FRB91_002786 [Serendipita sp. 411]KAG9055227.1 hypothetical protein FS842_002793 [Serendipita sp. 407]
MVITTGIVGGPLVSRQEIRVMAQDQDLMNLYLLALDRFQRVDQADTLSYFQIAGIHGRPYVPYDKAAGIGNFGGYCTHSSILFPPWHRPYLALFEQTLGTHVNNIANEFKDPAAKDRYQKAAQRFRLPYWDWAMNADAPDFVSMQKQVTLDTPNGTKTIDNPLYQYTFRPMYSTFGDGLPDEKMWESWPSTLRWPTRTDATGQSNPTQMERNLSNNRLTIRDRTYNLLTQARSYEAFSNDGFLGTSADPIAYDSLESIHGQMHGMTGRNGHMGVVDYAAFDPIFWLHHCNVDRVFALWQALNPNQYVVPRKNLAGTFATARGTTEDVNSPLAPFWKREGVYWTAADARDTRNMNYTYPELAKWASLTPQEKAVRLRSDINLMYGKSAPFAAIAPDLFALKPVSTTTNANNLAAISGKPATAPAISAGNPSASTGKPAQQPVAAAPAPALTQAERIRKNMEEGARLAREQAAAASHKVAAAPVAAKKAASTEHAPVASTSSSVAQKVAGTSASHPATLGAPSQPSTSGHQPKKESADFSTTDMSSLSGDKKHYNEWIANITVEKYAADATFYVYIFLGDFTPEPSLWGEDLNLVGTHVVFANNMNFTGCENCRDAAEAHKLVTGTIPLTGALGDKLGNDHVLEPAEVVPYLKKELHWRIQGHDNRVIERADMPSLKVSVAHIKVAIPTSLGEFPEWSTGEKAPEVTTGRAGGATEND